MSIKEQIEKELNQEFSDYSEIKRLCDLALKQEDDQDYGYKPQTVNSLAENDIEMAANSFQFNSGELDWYLAETELSRLNRKKIERIKEEQGI
jgi:hypothetical protein